MKKHPEREFDNLRQSIEDLGHALSFTAQAKEDPFYFRGIAKSFEISVEYAWKYFQRCAIEEGLEAFSPKDAIKMAGRLGMIGDVEAWLEFLENRNLAVHNYLGLLESEFLLSMQSYLREAKKIVRRETKTS